jgi:heat shock protein HtpX
VALLPDEQSRPILVYNRVQQNRRNTVLLVGLVPILLLPFVAGLVVYWLPWLLLGGAGQWLQGALPDGYVSQHPLRFELWMTAGATLALTVALTMVTVMHAWIFRALMIRATGARPVSRDAAPELWRVVENLCIGAGLPMPALYVVNTAAPNAFAAGRSPSHAVLTVTTGLLQLLDRRELEGVVAHELAHIGNQDTGLSTTLAAIVFTLRIPLAIVTGFYRSLSAFNEALGIFFLLGVFAFIGSMSAMSVASVTYLSSIHVPRWMIWRQEFVTVSPWFVLVGAPALGLLIRVAVSRQREFLADADAVVLTRDPEGLALALAKVKAWTGPRTLNIGPSAAHVCIVDPLPRDAPWWETILPSHPAIQDRIDILARMGNGISASALEAATAIGAAAASSVVVEAAAPRVVEPATGKIRVRGWSSRDQSPTDISRTADDRLMASTRS